MASYIQLKIGTTKTKYILKYQTPPYLYWHWLSNRDQNRRPKVCPRFRWNWPNCGQKTSETPAALWQRTSHWNSRVESSQTHQSCRWPKKFNVCYNGFLDIMLIRFAVSDSFNTSRGNRDPKSTFPSLSGEVIQQQNNLNFYGAECECLLSVTATEFFDCWIRLVSRVKFELTNDYWKFYFPTDFPSIASVNIRRERFRFFLLQNRIWRLRLNRYRVILQ